MNRALNTLLPVPFIHMASVLFVMNTLGVILMGVSCPLMLVYFWWLILDEHCSRVVLVGVGFLTMVASSIQGYAVVPLVVMLIVAALLVKQVRQLVHIGRGARYMGAVIGAYGTSAVIVGGYAAFGSFLTWIACLGIVIVVTLT